jgi:acetylornithine deacetylase
MRTTTSSLTRPKLRECLDATLESLGPVLLQMLEDLVRIPSENVPPKGNERPCQQYVASSLRAMGLEPDVYNPIDVPALASHPEYWPGRQYAGRPNVNAVRAGSGGGGRSLILSGHIDTVPADGPVEWQHAPFGAEVHGGRLFGRGAWDMKAGVAINLTVLRAFAQLGWKLKGDLIFETVVDEEFGGANGTLAARLRGYHADAAVLTESTSLRICPAQRGGRLLHILLQGPGGILATGRPRVRVVDQLGYLLSRLSQFAEKRGQRPIHRYYRNSQEPFAVWVTNIATGRWGWSQPITVPERCRIEIHWQSMPDETREDSETEFFAWWNQILAERSDLFPERPVITWPMRWLPGCAIAPDSPLVAEFSRCAAALDVEAPVEGLDAPSDMYVFQRCFQIPALMWGPSGANAHQADEYVELDSLAKAARVLAHFVANWCEVQAG